MCFYKFTSNEKQQILYIYSSALLSKFSENILYRRTISYFYIYLQKSNIFYQNPCCNCLQSAIHALLKYSCFYLIYMSFNSWKIYIRIENMFEIFMIMYLFLSKKKLFSAVIQDHYMCVSLRISRISSKTKFIYLYNDVEYLFSILKYLCYSFDQIIFFSLKLGNILNRYVRYTI